jgi:Ca-activated chloride channel homolog
MAVIKVLATVAALAVAAPPQFRTNIDVVRVEALVTDDGRPIAGLTADDLILTDNGAPQTIRVRPLGRDPIDVAIALDVSGSLQGARLERLRASALAFVGLLGPDDRATLLTFDHAVSLGPRDVGAGELEARLKTLGSQGRTSLVDAITAALVWGTGRERPMLVLVFSDGRDTASWTRADQALALARRSGAVVEVVVAGDLVPVRTTQRLRVDATRRPPSADERFLGELTLATGGRVRNGDAGEGLGGAFKASLDQFRARYEIAYEPTNKEPGWHAVEIQVKGRRGLAIHARRGYQR